MKKIFLFLNLFLSVSAIAQTDPCQEFLDNMATSLDSGYVAQAEKEMQLFRNCIKNAAPRSSKLKSLKDIRYITRFNNGTAIAKTKKNGYVLIHQDLITTLPLPYREVWEFTDGMAKVSAQEKFGFINTDGHLTIPLEYDDAWSFSEGLASVQKDNTYGYINVKNQLIIPHQYQQASPFHEGLAKVQLNDKWGFINKAGKTIIPCEYTDATSFSNGRAKVQRYGVWYTINNMGLCIENCEKLPSAKPMKPSNL